MSETILILLDNLCEINAIKAAFFDSTDPVPYYLVIFARWMLEMLEAVFNMDVVFGTP